MFLVQQLYFLHNILPHLGEASSRLLPASQHQAVFVVACADAIQRLPHGLQDKMTITTLPDGRTGKHQDLKCQLTILLYSSSSISLTFRQYD